MSEEEEEKERYITHEEIMNVFHKVCAVNPALRLRHHKKAIYLISVFSNETKAEIFYGQWLTREEAYDLLNREWLENYREQQDTGLYNDYRSLT